jgi:MFS family permease
LPQKIFPVTSEYPSLQPYATDIPARLDSLPWTSFHWLLILGLGVTWVLDGLEVTLMGAVAAVLQQRDVLALNSTQIGFISSCYLAGAVIGALVFGHLTDVFGRRKFFFLTLATYLLGVGLSACSWNLVSFATFRFITGAGIGGEYSAVNSAIDELTPARLRGRVALTINGSFWLGAAAGALATLVLLNPRFFAPNVGWRIGFALGPLLGLVILGLRTFIPESPRWLLTHGRFAEAEAAVKEIEAAAPHHDRKPSVARPILRIRARRRFGLSVAVGTIARRYRRRALLGLGLMAAQAFMYNAIFFTYALVLNHYYAVRPQDTGIYLIVLAVANFCGPLALGHWFDAIGRRVMIAASFAAAATLLLSTGILFASGRLDLSIQIAMWSAMFFFASAAASSAYLTVSEVFPLELRALAIAIFYAAGTAIGGIAGPWFFGFLIDAHSRAMLAFGYALAAALMFGAALLEFFLGVDAERRSLEEIAAPLSAEL